MRGFRIFLLVFGLCAVVAALAAPYAWRRLRDAENPFTGGLKRVVDESTAFAGEHEQLDCAPEAFRRLDACDGFWCRAQTPIFTQECLRRARPSPGLCDEIPDSMLQAALWPTRECLEIRADPDLCRRILVEIVGACQHKTAVR
jgi:hypothetical protein